MHTELNSRRLISLLVILTSFVGMRAQAQHVHGVIEIGVVVEAEVLAVTITAPLSDVAGFEHAPQNEEQEQRLQLAASKMLNTETMFGPTSAADCEVQSVAVSGPDYLEELLDEHAVESDEHDEHDNHDEHADHDETEHSEVVASYEWTCGKSAELDSLALNFTEHFANVESIEVQILTAAGARLKSLRGRVASLALSGPR